MLQLNFKINKHYLLLRSLKQYNTGKEWENFKNKLWEKFPKGFYLLSSYPELLFLKDSFLEFKKSSREAEKLIKKALNSQEFLKFYRQTKKYLNWVEHQWLKNKRKIIRELEDITKLSLGNQKISVYIVHPKLCNGMNIAEKNIIFWGHSEVWKNYTIVYLCHEILHIVTFKKFRNEKLIHTLIELATDNELKIRLNKKFDTFKNEKGEIARPFPKNLEREILFHQNLKKEIIPFWKKYLKENDSSKNILDLEKELLKNRKVKSILRNNKKL